MAQPELACRIAMRIDSEGDLIVLYQLKKGST